MIYANEKIMKAYLLYIAFFASLNAWEHNFRFADKSSRYGKYQQYCRKHQCDGYNWYRQRSYQVWRIYEANATPWLTHFMTPVEVNVPSTTTEVNYDGNEHTASISNTLTTAKGQVTEPEHIFGHDVTGTEVGTYKSQIYSNQLGYNIIYKPESNGTQNNTVYLVIKHGTTPTPEPTPMPESTLTPEPQPKSDSVLEIDYDILQDISSQERVFVPKGVL